MSIAQLKLNNIKIGLFGKLFLWFWVTSLSILTFLFIVLALITNPAELIYERQILFQQLDVAANKITKANNISVSTVTPVFPDSGYFLFDSYGGVISSSELSAPILSAYNKTKHFTEPNIFFENGSVIVGPKLIKIKSIFVQLYLTKPTPSLLHWRITQLVKNHLDLIIYAIIISLFFCLILATYLVKPIVKIKQVITELSTGNLSARVPIKITKRNDEIGNLAQTFNQMSEQLMTNIKSKENILRYVSHELRSPLTRLQLAVAISLKSSQISKDLCSRIELEIKRMDHLIKQIIDFSRITKQKKLDKISINFYKWIQQLIKDCDFEAHTQNKHIKLDFFCNKEIFINADSDLLVSAFENIIRNAIRHTPSGSRVDITVTNTNYYLDIIIRDYGTGIPDNMHDKIFHPFVSIDNKQSKSGFGLGMSIAKETVELHNGRILVANLDIGCQVIIRLPMF